MESSQIKNDYDLGTTNNINKIKTNQSLSFRIPYNLS